MLRSRKRLPCSLNNLITIYRPFDISTHFCDLFINDVLNVCHSIDPILKDPHTIIRYCTLEELLDSLCLVLTGLSSPLYVWDDNSESFRLRDATGNKEGTLILIGSDDVVGSR